MIESIKGIIKEILDKYQYLFFSLFIFAIFIKIVGVPTNIQKSNIANFIFPVDLLSGDNLTIIIWILELLGFLYLSFILMVMITSIKKLELLFTESFYLLQTIIEYSILFTNLFGLYAWIFGIWRNISIVSIVWSLIMKSLNSNILKADYFLYVGLVGMLILLGYSLLGFVYKSYK